MNPFRILSKRMFSRDRRRARRKPSVTIVAHYWDGAAPVAHLVRDISLTGLYLLTEQRWYPGTIIRMTLHYSDVPDAVKQGTIQVLSRVIRTGRDGVGCAFVLSDKPAVGSTDEMSAKALNRFLKHLDVTKSSAGLIAPPPRQNDAKYSKKTV